MNHSCSVRDKGQTLHPSAAPRRQVLIARSLARLQPSATYTILFLDQPTKGGWCSDSRPTSPAAFATSDPAPYQRSPCLAYPHEGPSRARKLFELLYELRGSAHNESQRVVRPASPA